MTPSARKSAFLFAVTSLLVAAFVALGKCTYDRHIRQIDSEAMRLSAEDVARRLSENLVNRASIEELYNSSVISAAKSLAKLIAIDPSVVTNTDAFAALPGVLGVDEVHVSDDKGVLIASVPRQYVGYDMASNPQSAVFLPAITDRGFEFVQKAMKKGSDGGLCQYAGVARQDRPGIVQVGMRPGRLESAASAADYRHITRTTHVGRGGYVNITRLKEEDRLGGIRSKTEIKETKNGREISLHTDCGSFRIIVTMPYRGWWLADDRPYELLVVSLILLLILLLLGGVRMFGRRGFRLLAFELGQVFNPLRGAVGSRRSLPIFVVATAVFALVVIFAWILANRSYRNYAVKLLDSSAAEFAKAFDFAVEDCLYFVGNAIVSAYPTPESFSDCDLQELLKRYHIDEFNSVDGAGRIIATTMNEEESAGKDNMWEMKSGDGSPSPWDFCVELLQNGRRTYAQTFRESAVEKGRFRMYAGVAFPKVSGFIQIGFDMKRIEKDFDYGLSDLADGWTFGESGYFMLARNTGEIVSCGHPKFGEATGRGEVTTLTSANFDVNLIPEVAEWDSLTPPFEAVVFGEPCLCISKRAGQYHRMISVMPVGEIEKGRNTLVTFVAVMMFVVLGLCAVFGARLFELVSRLREFIADDTRRRAEELRNAKAIQIESLPRIFPDAPIYKIYARMDTAKEVGGDFYDFYTLPSGKQLFLIADTSGKGIPAAMFMMKAKAVIRAGMFEAPDLATAVFEANNRLSESNDANMFVTAWIGVFDPETLEVQFVNCGHNPPLVKHTDGSVSWVRTRPGLALAAMSGVRYRVEKLTLARGESLFLYTDGATEAMNRSGEQYGEKRLENDLAAAPRLLFVDELREKVAAFVDGAEQSDDITMLSLDCKSKE